MIENTRTQKSRPQWGSRLMFILAAAGSAIGLGNIWKFPYITGMYGGGAFVLTYLITIIMVGLPIMAAEILIGKSRQLSPVPAIKSLKGSKTPWKVIGVVSILSAFIILSYYSVVSGWTLHYIFYSITGEFSNKDPQAIKTLFENMYTNAWINVFWHFVVMLSCSWIIFRGLNNGIEKASKILMPILFLLMLMLLVYSFTTPGAIAGIKFMLLPDFSKLTPTAILEAVGQGFFSLSLGMGAMITYGSYLKKESDIALPSVAIVFFDTTIAVLAGLAIFPIVFSYGLEPSAGPGLVFQTLPMAFSKMPGGTIFSVLFFVLLFFAALTSAISLLEVVTAYLVDSNIVSRKIGSCLSGFLIFALGIFSALSGGPLSHITIPLINRNIFDSFDYIASNWLLPLGGLVIALFTAWAIPNELRKKEFTTSAPKWWNYTLWLFLLRWIAPVGVILVFLNKIGVI